MPLYEYACDDCKDPAGEPRRVEIFKPFSDASRRESCALCGRPLRRIYSLQAPPNFNAYYEPLYKTTITSASQERKLMRRHGHVDGEPFRKKYSAHIKNAARKARNPHSVVFGNPRRKVA